MRGAWRAFARWEARAVGGLYVRLSGEFMRGDCEMKLSWRHRGSARAGYLRSTFGRLSQ